MLPERGAAAVAPAADFSPAGGGTVVAHAQVVVDPEPDGTDGGGVEARHFADIGKEGRIARAVARRALDARRAGEAAPTRATGHLLRRPGKGVAVAERRLELETRHDAGAAQVVRAARKTRRVFAVPRHRRKKDAR